MFSEHLLITIVSRPEASGSDVSLRLMGRRNDQVLKQAHRSDTVETDRTKLDIAFSLAYEELHRLAKRILNSKGVRDISATTLVNEAWLKLSGSPALADVDRLHFRRIVAQAMRFLLVDASRRRASRMRGSDVLVTFDESLYVGSNFHVGAELLSLDAALATLAAVAPRQAQLIEARFFGGFTVEEMVSLFGISESTVARELRVAKAWLAREVRQSH